MPAELETVAAQEVTEPTQEQSKQADEPQNALTQQFTNDEWAALKELRVSAIGPSPLTPPPLKHSVQSVKAP